MTLDFFPLSLPLSLHLKVKCEVFLFVPAASNSVNFCTVYAVEMKGREAHA